MPGSKPSQGNAKATITITLCATDTGTHADVQIDMAISGRLAQIGRGLIADVSAKLMGQFVDNLEAGLLASVFVAESQPAGRRVQAESSELALPPVEESGSAPVDLLATAGAPSARRLVPIALGFALAALLIWLMAN